MLLSLGICFPLPHFSFKTFILRMMVLLVVVFDKNVTSVNSEGLLYFTVTFLKNVCMSYIF